MSFDRVPLSLILLGTIALVLIALHLGARFGRRTAAGQEKSQVSGTMVGATMGLLAFMLAFTFNNAASRHDARKAIVIKETNAIETTWLRAGFLPELDRDTMRALLRDYVGLRVKMARSEIDLNEGLHQSESLQERMWAIAVERGRREPSSIALGLFVETLNEVIDLHLERLTVAVRARVPGTTWVTLYVLMVIGMIMTGVQIGQSGTRHRNLEIALAVAFSVVLFMTADLDRPQQGLVNVSQQAMTELQTKLDGR